MVRSRTEAARRRTFQLSKTKERAEEFHYQRVFRGDEVMDCLLLKERKLIAKELVRWEEVKKKVTCFDETQRRRNIEPEWMMEKIYRAATHFENCTEEE